MCNPSPTPDDVEALAYIRRRSAATACRDSRRTRRRPAPPGRLGGNASKRPDAADFGAFDPFAGQPHGRRRRGKQRRRFGSQQRISPYFRKGFFKVGKGLRQCDCGVVPRSSGATATWQASQRGPSAVPTSLVSPKISLSFPRVVMKELSHDYKDGDSSERRRPGCRGRQTGTPQGRAQKPEQKVVAGTRGLRQHMG
ncbi:hypothetical protein HMPREF0972_00002 [Actinomyces sp. oral taxon 848 str. F0332]|nr:hypothetical protein HMPREF0972_00002 [Actinomyces sp. oral taxon 848 str. F0332]